VFLNCSTCFRRHTAHHQELRWLSHRSGLQPKTYVKPKDAITVFERLIMGGLPPKHFEQLKKNIWIINSNTWLHLVGSFYEVHVTMHGSMNIKRTALILYNTLTIYTFNFKSKEKTFSKRIHVPAAYFRLYDLIYWNSSETDNLFLFILPFDGMEMCVSIEEYYRDNIASYKHTEVKNYYIVWSIRYECIKNADLKRSVHVCNSITNKRHCNSSRFFMLHFI